VRRRVALLIPLVLLVAAVPLHQVERGALFTSDTLQLLDGVAAADACLAAGEWRCERGVDKWPLLQYLPAIAMMRIGLDRADTAQGLVALNGLALALTFALAWGAAAKAGRAVAGVAVLAVLASPLLWYAGTGFAEALAAALTAAVVVALLRAWHPALVLVLVLLAGISKETAPPFLLAIGLVAVRLRRAQGLPDASLGLPAVFAGGVLAVVVNSAFNWFRYGQLFNEEYTRPGWVVSGMARRAEFFVAELVAPNGGLVWFWPVATAVLAVATVLAVRGLRSRPRADVAAPMLGAIGVGLAVTASLAGWWSPFGWDAYASRLLVPWVPALVLLALAAYGAELRALAGRLVARPAGAVVACLLLVAVTAPQLGAFLEPLAPLELFRKESPSCSALPADLYERVRAGDDAVQELHSACTSERAWNGELVLADGYAAFAGARIGFLPLLGAAVAGLVSLARREP